MIKILCDRCGRSIDPAIRYIGHVSLRYRETFDGELTGEDAFESWDLCHECMGEIEKFIRNGERGEAPEPEAEREPEPAAEPREPEQETHKRKLLDYGKIAALMAAGWKANDIAVEMGLSLSAAKSAMYRTREKGLLPEAEEET